MKSRTILVTIDGHQRNQIAQDTTPNLMAFSRRAETLADYRTVFPSCTVFPRDKREALARIS